MTRARGCHYLRQEKKLKMTTLSLAFIIPIVGLFIILKESHCVYLFTFVLIYSFILSDYDVFYVNLTQGRGIREGEVSNEKRLLI